MRITSLLAGALWLAALPSAPAAAKPNIVVILVDDLGWSDLPAYGGEIPTPNLDELAATGVKFREFYVTPRCAPTRASLMTGLYSHRVADNPANALPSMVNTNNATLAEILRSNGYRTYMAGKWNLGTGALLPENRGFQHVWRFGDGSAHSLNAWNKNLYTVVSPNAEIATRDYAGPGEVFYQSDAIGDYSVDFISHDLAKGDAPFFLYMAFGAPHFPLAAPQALVDANVATYAAGWDVIRRQRYDRQMANGVIDSRYPFSPLGPTAPHDTEPIEPLPAWNTLPVDRQADLVRRMALYAAMVQKIDANVGKVVAKLKATGQYDNTLIMFLSDNGADHEFGKFGTWANGATGPALTGTALANMGLPGTADPIYIGGGWAHVSSTPLRLFKHHAHEGGIRAPLIMHWPAGSTVQNVWSEAVGDVIDIVPTALAAAGVSYPNTFNGHGVLPVDGVSLLPVLQGNLIPARPLFVEHESNRMMRDGDWKLVTKNFTFPDGTSPANEKELYNMALDPAESQNVANANPSRVVTMVDAWNAWAKNAKVPSERFFAALPLNVTPAATSSDLFLDTFNRANGTDADASATGMSGSRVPPLGGDAAWFEGFEGSGTPDSISIVDNTMQKLGIGMMENGLNHNFVGPDITAAGGFSVSLRVVALNTALTDTANRFVGFGVGLNAAQASKGNDLNTNVASPRPIRGSTTNKGAADCFVELDADKNVKVWVQGAIKATVTVGATAGTLTAAFQCTGFAPTDPVTVAVYFNGKRLDLNPPADGNSNPGDTLAFTWDEANANYVAICARGSVSAILDNFAVRRLPLNNALAVEYAISRGFDGPDTAPAANPDGDQLNNYSEWAFGTDPRQADDLLAGTSLTFTNPVQGFRFAHRRLTDYQSAGINYKYSISSDLQTWLPTNPSTVATTGLLNSVGYEAAELRLPDSDLLDKDRLFLKVEAVTP